MYLEVKSKEAEFNLFVYRVKSKKQRTTDLFAL